MEAAGRFSLAKEGKMSEGDFVTWEPDGEQGRVTCITPFALAVLWEVTGGPHWYPVNSLAAERILPLTEEE
jgi:hypothetical protein